jgi:hypothetical protein
MRIRSLVPKFWESEDIERLPWDTRLVFIGLWSYADDNGVGRDDARLIAADLFPLAEDPRECRAKVSRGLQTLFAGGQITRYTLDGTPLFFIIKWDEYQRVDRPGKTRYPRPTCDDAGIPLKIATDSRDHRESPATGEGEKGRRGEGEKLKPLRPRSADAAPRTRADVEAICTHLADKIQANGSNRPTITNRWRTDARLMIDQDGRSEPQIIAAIDWAQASTFWRGNIMSIPKLREKYDQLRLAAESDRSSTRVNGRIPTADQRVMDGLAIAQRLAAEEQAQDHHALEIRA